MDVHPVVEAADLVSEHRPALKVLHVQPVIAGHAPALPYAQQGRGEYDLRILAAGHVFPEIAAVLKQLFSRLYYALRQRPGGAGVHPVHVARVGAAHAVGHARMVGEYGPDARQVPVVVGEHPVPVRLVDILVGGILEFIELEARPQPAQRGGHGQPVFVPVLGFGARPFAEQAVPGGVYEQLRLHGVHAFPCGQHRVGHPSAFLERVRHLRAEGECAAALFDHVVVNQLERLHGDAVGTVAPEALGRLGSHPVVDLPAYAARVEGALVAEGHERGHQHVDRRAAQSETALRQEYAVSQPRRRDRRAHARGPASRHEHVDVVLYGYPPGIADVHS